MWTTPAKPRRNAPLARLVAVIVALCAPAATAWSADITGTIRSSEKDDPVDFVTVQVLGSAQAGQDVTRGVMSTSSGFYFIPDIPRGRYVVRFSRIGFQVREDSVRVADESTVTLNVVLTVAPVAVEEIVVEGDRYAGVKDVQPGFLNLKADRLAALPGIVEADPIRSLVLLPGVQSASDFSSGLYVRGGGPDQTLVLLDRVTVYNPTHAFGFFSTFNADALDEVNLYKGAYPAEYGGRLGAVLDVRSRVGNNEGLAGKGGVSTIASRLEMDGPVGGGTWLASARRTHLEPILDALRRHEDEIPDYYFYDVNTRLSIPAAGGTVSVSGYTGRDDLLFDLDEDTILKLNWGNRLLAASYRRTLGGAVVAEVRASATEYKSTTDIVALNTPIAITNRIREVTGVGDVKWEAADGVEVDGGIVATQYDVRYFQDFNGERQVDYFRRPYEGAAYAETRWTPMRGTILLGGVRARYLEDGRRWLAEPRLSASHRVNDHWRAKVGGGLYHQYLQLVSTEGFSASDFYVPIDATSTPGKSWQTVAGVEWEPSAAYEVSVEGYYTNLRDLVQFNTTASSDSRDTETKDLFYTGGTGYATGAEVFLQRRRGALTGWVGYTLGWTRRRFPGLNQNRTFPPKYDRRHDLSAVGQYVHGKWTFGATFVLASGQAFTPAAAAYDIRNPVTGTVGDPILLPAARNSARLLPYHRLDVSASRDVTWFGRSFEWFVQIFNVYNRRNEWFVQYNTDRGLVEPDVIKMLPIVPSAGINFEF
jgi:hypothetical protein